MSDNNKGSWNIQTLNHSHEKGNLIYNLMQLASPRPPSPIEDSQCRWDLKTIILKNDGANKFTNSKHIKPWGCKYSQNRMFKLIINYSDHHFRVFIMYMAVINFIGEQWWKHINTILGMIEKHEHSREHKVRKYLNPLGPNKGGLFEEGTLKWILVSMQIFHWV